MSVAEHHEEFNWKGILIRQKKDVFKVGTDALLLGAWIPKIIMNPTHILDAGTGTGILALMMAYFFPESRIVALDEEEPAISLAQHNFQHSPWPGRIFVQQENILKVPFSEKVAFDLIVCNPPFYYDQMRAKAGIKLIAKHADAPSSVWLEALRARLNTTGHLCIVLPYEFVFEWIKTANELGLYCQHRLDIFSFRHDRKPIRSLLDFQAILTEPEISQLCIHEQFNRYTEEYISYSGMQQKEK